MSKLLLTCFSLILLLACNSQDKQKSEEANSNKKAINMEAPFYTHQLPPGHPRISKNYDSSIIENYWPFIVYYDGSYMVSAEVESATLLKYISFFERNGGDGSGENWAGLLKVALKSENPNLLKQIDLDPETGGFYAFADGPDSQSQFAKFCQSLFKDTAKMIRYLNGPERDEILEFDPSY